jgi:glycerate 2-kinase
MTAEAQIEQWFREILVELDPRRLTRQAESLRAIAREPLAGGTGKVIVVAIGKAAIAMAAGAQDALGERFERGYVLTVDGPDASILDDRWTVFRAGHPIPDQRGIDATRQIIAAVEDLNSDDRVVALISGGGSALFEAPHEPLTLADFANVTQLLLNAGAPIQHLNGVRIPLSRVKGGSFRRLSPAGTFVTLILSDVLGNDVKIIASGPTVAPVASGAGALAILDLYGLRDVVPAAVRSVLNEAAGEPDDWGYPSDLVEIVGDLAYAKAIAWERSSAEGFCTRVVDGVLGGEASVLARNWVADLLSAPETIDVVWGGGEATVTVRGRGIGGRNTEFALAAALELDRLGNDDWVVASLATDGQDGVSGSAGAIASRETIVRARALGLDPFEALEQNDSGAFFSNVGGLVMTGPSGTNVNDLYVGMRRQS